MKRSEYLQYSRKWFKYSKTCAPLLRDDFERAMWRCLFYWAGWEE